ncbi:ABC-F family ATP-binding cassette domain-containing protein [Actinomycetaceae bacterium MB13-C1-2]|nr:ABC-F family ATP-binding cassette domain-containing protein [Actinomycetaceae bacterium MB13-C1-2]
MSRSTQLSSASEAVPSRRASHLRIEGLSVSFPDRRVLTDVSFIVPAGDRVGLIGENGSGKSTLLRAIAGIVRPSGGTVRAHVPGITHPRIGLLHQEPPSDSDETVAGALEDAVAPAREAAKAVAELGSLLAENPNDQRIAELYARVLEEAERLDAWEIDTRIATMLSGLGLSDIESGRLTGQLSGGQRARLSLVWLLLSTPDILLLDEPTNHLDDSATAYLVGVLRSWRGPVLMASHDRAFLDEVATSLVDLDPAPVPHAVSSSFAEDGPGSGIGVTRFTGNYSDYLGSRADTMRRWNQRYRDEQVELKRLRKQVREQHTVGHPGREPRTEARAAKKFYADRNAKVVSRRVNDARLRLEELERDQVRKPPTELEFRGLVDEEERGGISSAPTVEPVLVATNIGVEGRLNPLSLSISRGEKWLLTGPNGSGKSTLLSVLAEKLEPTSGSLGRSRRDRVRLLSQEIDVPGLGDPGSSKTASQFYRQLVGDKLADEVPLGSLGLIAGRDLNRPLADLSTGQQRRLALAALLADPPEILLLDEPTNHFSLALVTAIESALPDYPGTVVVASHDRWLRKNWSGKTLTLE